MPGGLRQSIQNIEFWGPQTLFRPSQVYSSVTGAYTLFRISGGAVLLLGLYGRHTAVAGGATTVTGTVDGIATDSGAADIGTSGGTVGRVVWIPLNVGQAPLPAAAIPLTVATSTKMLAGTAVGTIVLTFAVSTVTMEWTLIWQRLAIDSLVVVA